MIPTSFFLQKGWKATSVPGCGRGCVLFNAQVPNNRSAWSSNPKAALHKKWIVCSGKLGTFFYFKTMKLFIFINQSTIFLNLDAIKRQEYQSWCNSCPSRGQGYTAVRLHYFACRDDGRSLPFCGSQAKTWCCRANALQDFYTTAPPLGLFYCKVKD